MSLYSLKCGERPNESHPHKAPIAPSFVSTNICWDPMVLAKTGRFRDSTAKAPYTFIKQATENPADLSAGARLFAGDPTIQWSLGSWGWAQETCNIVFWLQFSHVKKPSSLLDCRG